RNTPDRRPGPYSPRRLLYTPPDFGPGRSMSRARSSAEILQTRTTRRAAEGRRARTPSPRRLDRRAPFDATPDGINSRLSPSLPYTAGGGGRQRRAPRHGRVVSAPRQGRSMSHPRRPLRSSQSADRYGRSPVRLQPALHGPTKRTMKQRAVKGGGRKTQQQRPTPWRPVGDPTARQYRTRPDNYASGSMIAN
ncbi:hypothetical protein PFISCL1PPCAC_26163, partial [Pristionchus fissidentatus]